MLFNKVILIKYWEKNLLNACFYKSAKKSQENIRSNGGNMKKSKLVIVSLLFVVASSFMLLDVQSHTPSNVTLSYDYGTQTLEVTVYHTVSDPNTHYIEQIQIWKNDVSQINQTYTSQTSDSQHVDSFNIDATDGDILKVTATCNVGGSYTNQITVTDPAIPEFGTYMPFILIGLISISGFIIYLKRRK